MGRVRVDDDKQKLSFLNEKTRELSKNIDISEFIKVVDISEFERTKNATPIFLFANYLNNFKCCRCNEKIKSKTIYYSGGHGCKICEKMFGESNGKLILILGYN